VRELLKSIYSQVRQYKQSMKNRKAVNNERFTNKNPKYAHYDIGDWTYGNPIIKSWDEKTKLTIGKFCSIAGNVQLLLGGEHRKDWITTFPFSEFLEDASFIEGHPHTKGDVTIGNDVWICQNAIILSGVNIGNGAIIGAGCVVTKDVPAYAIVAGNPPRIVGLRFSEYQIAELEKIAWWDWEIERITEQVASLLSVNVDEFINQNRKG